MALIFVVDGVFNRCNLARNALEQAGYTVETFSTEEVLEAAEQQVPQLVLIAVTLPNGSGIELYREMRRCPALSRTKIIFVVDGREMESGTEPLSEADALLNENFTASEVVSCVHAVLFRFAPMMASTPQPSMAEIVINSSAMRVKVLGNELTTTALEFRLIEYMARHRGKVFTRDALLDAVWGDLHFVSPRTVDACVGRIRRKIGDIRSAPTYLKTIRGIGYKLDATTEWEAAPNEFCQCPICAQSRARAGAAAGRASN